MADSIVLKMKTKVDDGLDDLWGDAPNDTGAAKSSGDGSKRAAAESDGQQPQQATPTPKKQKRDGSRREHELNLSEQAILKARHFLAHFNLAADVTSVPVKKWQTMLETIRGRLKQPRIVSTEVRQPDRPLAQVLVEAAIALELGAHLVEEEELIEQPLDDRFGAQAHLARREPAAASLRDLPGLPDAQRAVLCPGQESSVPGVAEGQRRHLALLQPLQRSAAQGGAGAGRVGDRR